MFSPLTQQLIQSLRHLPGIGPKSAQRLAFYLLSDVNKTKGLALACALQNALETVGQCERCNIYTEQTLCDICQHPKRNHSVLCIVENPVDVAAIEQTHSYSGLYFVLRGRLSPLDGIGPAEIGIDKLLDRVKKSNIQEIILATNTTVEGRATAHYIAEQVSHANIKCTRIAYGVPLGGELEYLDGGTLSHALACRIPISLVP